MLDTSARLLRLLSLFQGRRYWPGAELAERLEITIRTLRRDVDKLRALGYPIHSSAGAGGGYQMGAGATMPPLLLDDEEAVAVALGLRYAATGAVENTQEASVRALAKIEQILPSRLARRVAALQSVVVTSANPAVAVDAKRLSSLAAACRDNEMLRFRYCDRTGVATARLSEPHRLVYSNERWYLVAWDSARQDWRTFRVDRMQGRITTTGTRFQPRELPARDLAAWVTQGAAYAPPCRARIRVKMSAEALADRIPRGVGLIEPVDSETCVLETGGTTWEFLAMHLGWIGADFEVSEPPELADAVRQLGERYARSLPLRQKDT